MKKHRPCLICGEPYLTTVDWRIHPTCKSSVLAGGRVEVRESISKSALRRENHDETEDLNWEDLLGE